MTVKELRTKAKKQKIKGYSTMNKPDLVMALSMNTKPSAKKTTTKKSAKNALVVKDITKKYGKVKVLDGISFSIKEGERVAIIGANGAGKTTLTEIISTVKEPTSGKITYAWGKTARAISSGIGIQFQDSTYPMFYKVIDLIKFVLDASKIKLTKEQLDRYLVDFKLKGMENKYATALSGGQKQRLNILLAIVNEPKLLLLDEVSTGLDVESRTELKAFIRNYLDETKSTLILVSHNIDEIDYLTDRIITIENGIIYEDLSIKEVHKKFGTTEKYVDDLFMNKFKIEENKRKNK